ncbi:uncharacterized protein LOC133802319 [Humulus lupulus]|uniref:uncharacterized protein LOC133802319 n=1 Tax=Humulus lupulus TaxID=3486 RepID=UPI002B40C89E|nr:uncharacterized protein LOC133802319 [Humulus lupulus]
MKLAEYQTNALGRQPEFGAIFMSNSTTRKECLRRKLFGLPPSSENFVKQIKAGMILFLFEYESRLLYGVFQAISDGGMNIVPNAFSSIGKRYPAQVKFKSIWFCYPLRENEFSNAIKENYFSSKKFSFGLSEVQVRRLLQIFSERKFKDSLGDGHIAKSAKVKSNTVRHDNNSRSNFKHRIDDEYVSGNSNVDIEHRSATTTKSPLLDKVERDSDELTFPGWVRKGYCLDAELGPAISPEYSKYHYGDVRRLSGDYGLLMNGKFQSGYNKDNGFNSAVLSEYPALLKSNHLSSVFSRNPLLVTNSLVPDQAMPPSTVHHQMESQLLSNLSSKASYGDAVVMSTHPYDSDAPRRSYQYPSTNLVNYSSTAGGRSLNEYSESLISSSREQSFFSYPESKVLSKCLDKISTYGEDVSFPGPNCNESLHNGAVMGVSRAAYSENVDVKISKHHFYTGNSSKYPITDVPSLETSFYVRKNKLSACDPLDPTVYPSLVGDYGYQVEPEDQLEDKLYEDPLTLHGFCSSLDPQSFQHYEHDSFRYDREHHQSYDTLDSGPLKNRVSAFSRLALPRDAYLPPSSVDGGYKGSHTSTSVDGIMDMLHKNHHEWSKSRKPKQENRQDSEKLISKKVTTLSCKDEAENKDVDRSLIAKKKAMQLTQENSLFNFKRRSELRKPHNDGTTSECKKASATEGSRNGQQRKRKLVRPNFCKIGSTDVEGMKNCTTSEAPAIEILITKDNTEGCKASTGNQDNENKISQSVKEPLLVCQQAPSDEDFETESSKPSVNTFVSLINGVELGKETLNNTHIQNATMATACEDKNSHGDRKHLRCSDSYETTDESAENECERINKVEKNPNSQSAGERGPATAHNATFNRINSSRYQVSDWKMEAEVHSATCVDASNENEQQVPMGSSTKQSEPLFDKLQFSNGVCRKRKLKACSPHTHHATFNMMNSSIDPASEMQVQEHSVTCIDARQENEPLISSGLSTRPSEQSLEMPEISLSVVHRKIKRNRST